VSARADIPLAAQEQASTFELAAKHRAILGRPMREALGAKTYQTLQQHLDGMNPDSALFVTHATLGGSPSPEQVQRLTEAIRQKIRGRQFVMRADAAKGGCWI
jgi:hypothetical protein